MQRMSRRGWRVAAVVALAMVPASMLSAQMGDFRRETTRGIGYSGSIPDAKVGIGAWQFFGASRIGVFVDAKTTLPSREKHENYCPSGLGECTVEWVETNRNDLQLDSEDEYTMINGGAMYAHGQQFAV